MKTFSVMLIGLSSICSTTITFAEQQNNQPDVYQQSYALYMLYHPETKEQNSKALVENFHQDYQPLFQKNKKVNADQFVQYEQARLDPLLKQRRDMSLKQAHVRYGILNSAKNQKLTLKEFQEIGLKAFNEMDKNQDGVINIEDVKLTENNVGTHDGFRVRLPISMPIANNPQEFIQLYGQGKDFVTLGDYLTARDQQFYAMDTQHKHSVTESEYVDEFMQRYDQNSVKGKEKMKDFSLQQFKTIANGKPTIQMKDIEKFAKKLDQSIS
jgi:hypothetical protein